MAERRPLVNVSGSVRELPTGDTLPEDTTKVDNASGQTLTLWKGTQAEYDAIGTKDSNTVYVVAA